MSTKITDLEGMEILDSRGNPTLRVTVVLENGVKASASVPSGASTGANEALELRDKSADRYGGKGVHEVAQRIRDEIKSHLVGRDARHQADVDGTLNFFDGTKNKSKYGANAILGVSMAVARAAAQSVGLPLYAYLGGPTARHLPMPMMNVINGGGHADNSLDFQEFMIMPVGSTTYAEALRAGAETYHALKTILRQRGLTTSVGDEGGFAPDLESNEAACDLLIQAIELAGRKPGKDIAIALDPAASAFRSGDRYDLRRSGKGQKSSAEMVDAYKTWVSRYPIVSIEDGLAEDDWVGFAELTAMLGDQVQIVGDDLYVTNTDYIARGIRDRASNAVLIKLNQIGTVTETVDAIEMCRRAGWRTIVSHRSGETDDTFIADFAVAMGCGQIKTGSLSRGERIAKYNRLLEIQHELGTRATFTNPFDAAERR